MPVRPPLKSSIKIRNYQAYVNGEAIPQLGVKTLGINLQTTVFAWCDITQETPQAFGTLLNYNRNIRRTLKRHLNMCSILALSARHSSRVFSSSKPLCCNIINV